MGQRKTEKAPAKDGGWGKREALPGKTIAGSVLSKPLHARPKSEEAVKEASAKRKDALKSLADR